MIQDNSDVSSKAASGKNVTGNLAMTVGEKLSIQSIRSFALLSIRRHVPHKQMLLHRAIFQ